MRCRPSGRACRHSKAPQPGFRPPNHLLRRIQTATALNNNSKNDNGAPPPGHSGSSGEQQGENTKAQGRHDSPVAAVGEVLSAAGESAVRLEHAAEEALERELVRHPRWRTPVAVAGWLLVGIYFLFALTFLGLRYWVLPNIGSYTESIERAVSQAIGERVTIGSVQAGWQGLRPEINISDLRVYDKGGRPALSLPVVEAVVGWSSVFYGSLRFESLALERPRLEVRRDSEGQLHVAGILLRSDPSQPGLSDWLLSQRAVMIRDAQIAWDDDLRRAPRLELSGVNLLLRNSGDIHRFALRAAAARELASALDVRGELRGVSLAQSQDWTGQVYAELEYTDLAAWQKWFDYPVELRSGQGGLRLWLGFAGRRLTEVTADVALARVSTRLRRELPLLELDFLHGRLGGKETRIAEPMPTNVLPGEATQQFRTTAEVFGRGVALRTKGGVALPPADFSLRVEPVGVDLFLHGGGADSAKVADTIPPPKSDRRNERGEFTANALDFQPLAQLAEFLPLPEALRKRLGDTDPRGRAFDLKYTWSGPIEQPQQYSLRSRFDGLGLSASGGLPGFTGISGTTEASEKGGSLTLLSRNATIELPGILIDQKAQFDTLGGQIGWRHNNGRLELKLTNLAFANPDLAGTLSGSYEARPPDSSPDSRGVIDLTGQFSRAEGPRAWRYIPRLPEVVQTYLTAGVIAGRSNDVRLRLKGDLAKFPFDDPKQGLFQVSAKVTGGEFLYAPGWPQASAITGDLMFDGLRLQVTAQRATILGVRAANVRVGIPDIFHRNEIVTVEGQAEGATPDFLRFIDTSPLNRVLDAATQDMRAGGNGRLQLKVELPIRKPEAVKVAGNYQFQNNQFTFDPDLPPVTQLNGRLEFSETGISTRAPGGQLQFLTGQFLGGPISASLQSRPDGGIAVAAQGTAGVAALRRFADLPHMDRVTGAAAWRSNLNIRRRNVEFNAESTLQGVTIDMPPPFGKTAAETMALRIERTAAADSDLFKRFAGLRLAPRGDAISVSLGAGPARNVNALLTRRSEGRGYAVDRGVIALNEAAALPDRAGIMITGNLPMLEFERWQTVLAENPAPPAAGGAAPGVPAAPASQSSAASVVSGANLKITALDVGGKRFHDLSIRATAKSGVWAGTVEAREFAGEAQWRPEGRGRVQARLKHLTLHEERAPGPAQPQTPTAQRELPAIDVVAEDFVVHERRFGRLELLAANDGREWRIEKLQLSSPDGTLAMDGVWQTWAARPSVNVNLKLDVSDAGRYLERMGFAKLMQSGRARLEGRVGWAGNPQTVDYPTLTGNLSLSAEKGQFLKADPGIAKLLGVLSLQSLVTLDLRDLFREGFSYDTIGGTGTISKGVLQTQDFRMKGASAAVNMSGTIDLANENQRLHMRVVPSVGDGASTLAGFFLANPLLGLGATLFQRLLKDPLGQIFAVEYDVTGTWDEPKVTRTKVDIPKAASEGIESGSK